jgi:hypothetical protein
VTLTPYCNLPTDVRELIFHLIPGSMCLVGDMKGVYLFLAILLLTIIDSACHFHHCNATLEVYTDCVNNSNCTQACSHLNELDELQSCDFYNDIWCDFNDCCCPDEGRAHYECLLPDECLPCAVDTPTSASWPQQSSAFVTLLAASLLGAFNIRF